MDPYRIFNLKEKNGFFKPAVASVLMTMVIALFFSPAAEARNIKVGIIDCYSGPAAVYANDALEGLTIESPVGPIEMRACDHQAVLPIFLGVTKKSTTDDFVISSDIVTLSGGEIMPSCDEIAAARK